jgi:hypothetical protein
MRWIGAAELSNEDPFLVSSPFLLGAPVLHTSIIEPFMPYNDTRPTQFLALCEPS